VTIAELDWRHETIPSASAAGQTLLHIRGCTCLEQCSVYGWHSLAFCDRLAFNDTELRVAETINTSSSIAFPTHPVPSSLTQPLHGHQYNILLTFYFYY
jgi:hypothetical protein